MEVKIKKHKNHNHIVEKSLGIGGDYQYKALRSHNFLRSFWHRNKLLAIKSLVKMNRDSTVLDLGTGSGNFELEFASKVKSITGIDYNDEAINFIKKMVVRERINNVRLLVADLREISSIKNLGKFDLIILIDVIEHLEMTDIKRMIKGFNKLLLGGGRICIITPNYGSLWSIIEKLMDRYNLSPHLEGDQHLTFFNMRGLKNLFLNQGYNVEKLASFNLFSFAVPNGWLSSVLCKIELMIPLLPGNLIIGVFSKND